MAAYDYDEFMDVDRPRPGPSSSSTTSFLDRALAARDDDEDNDDARLGFSGPRPITVYDGGDDRAPGVRTEPETELQRLVRHWMNERHAPDILPAQETLLGGLLDRIRRQTETIQLLRADPDSSEDEHFRIVLAQTELERVKFLVRSYVRTRIAKIEKYARWINSNSDVQARLTQTELDHAKRFAQLTESHFHHAVLRSLPEQQQSLEDQPAFMPSMITEPDKTKAVFAHARVTCPPVRLPDGRSVLTMEQGQISLTPYAVVEQLLLRDEVELV